MRLVTQKEALREYKDYYGEKSSDYFKDRLPGHFQCPCPQDKAWVCDDHGAPSTNGCTAWRFNTKDFEVSHLTEESYGRYCHNCKFKRRIFDIVANPIGYVTYCTKGLNGNPDNERIWNQEHREGYGLHNVRRDLLGNVLPPELGQPIEWGRGSHRDRYQLFQLSSVYIVKVARKKPVWHVSGWVHNGSFSGGISKEIAQFLMALGVPNEDRSASIANTAMVKKYVDPIRKKLGFESDPWPHRQNREEGDSDKLLENEE